MRNYLSSSIAGALMLVATTLSPLESKADNLEKQLIRHEGYRTSTYLDTKGIPTIGVGFNLQRPDASNLLQKVNADYNKILQGNQKLDDSQIMRLFRYDLSNAVINARQIVKTFDKQPPQVQEVIVNMTFNLGPGGLKKFKKMINAVDSNDYATAAHEMKDSIWYTQVGNRSKELVQLMQNAKR